MARYVNAEKIIVEIENYFCNFLQSQKFDGYESADPTSQWHCDGLIKAIEIIMDAPTADVRENVHGHWIVTGRTNVYGGKEVTCSNCKDTLMIQDLEREHFCRNCGAKMT